MWMEELSQHFIHLLHWNIRHVKPVEALQQKHLAVWQKVLNLRWII